MATGIYLGTGPGRSRRGTAEMIAEGHAATKQKLDLMSKFARWCVERSRSRSTVYTRWGATRDTERTRHTHSG